MSDGVGEGSGAGDEEEEGEEINDCGEDCDRGSDDNDVLVNGGPPRLSTNSTRKSGTSSYMVSSRGDRARQCTSIVLLALCRFVTRPAFPPSPRGAFAANFTRSPSSIGASPSTEAEGAIAIEGVEEDGEVGRDASSMGENDEEGDDGFLTRVPLVEKGGWYWIWSGLVLAVGNAKATLHSGTSAMTIG